MAAASQTLTTVLKGPDGVQIATAKFEFANGFATVTLQTTSVGVLAPGFHDASSSFFLVSTSPSSLRGATGEAPSRASGAA